MTTRIFLLAVSFFSCAAASPAPPDALTFAALTDQGVLVMIYDGQEAAVFEDGRLARTYEARSGRAALWDLGTPDLERMSGVLLFDRALDADEVLTLGDCGWPPVEELVDCSLQSCACEELAHR